MVKMAVEASDSDYGFESVFLGAKMAVEKDSSLEVMLVAGKYKIHKEDFDLNENVSLEISEYTYDPYDKKKF